MTYDFKIYTIQIYFLKAQLQNDTHIKKKFD